MDTWAYNDVGGETLEALKMAYGMDTLMVKVDSDSDEREATDFEDFILYAHPHKVLDTLEAFYKLLPENETNSLQANINAVLSEEYSPWLMSDGLMYMIDNRFLDALKEQVEADMKDEGFWGAHEEFKEARSYLLAGSVDVAIHKANCSFESALKSLLNQKGGTLNSLLKTMSKETDLLDAVSPAAKNVISSKVLHGLTILRNNIGGHGQGAMPVDVPRAYGEFALNLAAAYTKFLIDLKREKDTTPDGNDLAEIDEEDLPF